MHVKSELIDARNFDQRIDDLLAEIEGVGIVGFDIETHDKDRHEGLNEFMKKTKKLVFDTRRTTVTGFSWYPDGGDTAYYLNLAHADVENRVPRAKAQRILDLINTKLTTIHNAPYELTMCKTALGHQLKGTVCTLQMAVSDHNKDQYPVSKMLGAGFGGMKSLLHSISREFVIYDQQNPTPAQDGLLMQVLAKESVAGHSYNGYVRELAYGYGLKSLTKKFFDYDQTSFETVMAGRAHMGELTGEEVVAYGADDAYWTVRLFHLFLARMSRQNDKLVDTFMTQENPMTQVFADIWSGGLRINREAVLEARDRERSRYADAIRELHTMLNRLLPFPEPNKRMLELEAWYARNPTGYRDKLTKWLSVPLPEGDKEVVGTVSGPVSTGWGMKSNGPNPSYYMTMRTMLYDLTGLNPIVSDGKVQSDKGARAKLRERVEALRPLLDILETLATIEQSMKLYLNPYLLLIDPETSRVYPVVSSQLNSRRMAMSFPNGMQLAKRGESTYVRGFYEADDDESVIISLDWSQIELVEIGDFSGDPEFAKCFGQIPYEDLHKGTAADILGIAVSEVTKDLRTKIGKGANFNYWYSGALSTVGEVMGWSATEMWERTERYRTRFSVAEEWRVDLINEARERGFITLPDGHRRVVYEASYEWKNLWTDRWGSSGSQGLVNFGREFVRRISTRAGNQIVNSMVQGSCATIAKRSILAIIAWMKEAGIRGRFLMPIHDELVFSVHRDDALVFVRQAKKIMCHHPEIITRLQLDATASIGRTFEPFKGTGKGQIEIDEAPVIEGYLGPETKGQRLDDDGVRRVLDYLFSD